MTEAHQPHTEAALDVVEREIEYATAERAAFRRFRARLTEVEPSAPAATGGRVAGGGVLAGRSAGSSGESLAAAREAYRETVMAVPHYDSEYGEPLRENAALEFGDPLAAVLADGDRLTPQHRDALLAAATRARGERDSFIDLLERERESLRRVRDALDECEVRAVELGQEVTEAPARRAAALDDELATLAARCEDLAAERQDLLHGRSVSHLSGVTADSLTGFLYGARETSCPALADVASCLDTVRYYRRVAADRAAGELTA